MKPKDLTDNEINVIYDDAVKRFSTNSAKRERNFLCECVISAFIDHCAVKKYLVQNGKIYADENRRK